MSRGAGVADMTGAVGPRAVSHGVVLSIVGMALLWIRLPATGIDLEAGLGVALVSGGVTLAAGPALLAHRPVQRAVAGVGAAAALALAVVTTYVAIGPVVLAVLALIALVMTAVASVSARTG
jgi:hypothetical protein